MSENDSDAYGIPKFISPVDSKLYGKIHIFVQLEKITFRTALSFVKGCFSLCPEYDFLLIKYTTSVSFCQQKIRNLSDLFVVTIQINLAYFLKYLLSIDSEY